MYEMSLSEYHARKSYLELEIIEKNLRFRHLDQQLADLEPSLSHQSLSELEMKNYHFNILQSSLLKHQLAEFRQELLYVKNAIHHLTIKQSLKVLKP